MSESHWITTRHGSVELKEGSIYKVINSYDGHEYNYYDVFPGLGLAAETTREVMNNLIFIGNHSSIANAKVFLFKGRKIAFIGTEGLNFVKVG